MSRWPGLHNEDPNNMNVQSDTSLDDESTVRRMRPTTGYALSLVIAGAGIGIAEHHGHIILQRDANGALHLALNEICDE